MIKLAGAVLVWSGCTLWGLLAVAGLHCRVRVLEDIVQALELLERELALSRNALPELLERMSHRTTRQGRDLFCHCREGIEKGSSFAHSWSEALNHTVLKEEERVLLSCLSQMLGRYDAQGQIQALSQLRKELERLTERVREQTRSLGKVYGVLGVTAGGFLALTLA